MEAYLSRHEPPDLGRKPALGWVHCRVERGAVTWELLDCAATMVVASESPRCAILTNISARRERVIVALVVVVMNKSSSRMLVVVLVVCYIRRRNKDTR